MYTNIKKTYIVYPIPNEVNLHGRTIPYDNMKRVVEFYNNKHDVDRHYLEYLSNEEFVTYETIDTRLKHVVAKAGLIYEKDKVFYCDVEYLNTTKFKTIEYNLDDLTITSSKSGTVSDGVAYIKTLDKLTIEHRDKILSKTQIKYQKIKKTKDNINKWKKIYQK